MSGDAKMAVRGTVENAADFPEHLCPCWLQVVFSGIKQQAVRQMDGDLIPGLLDGNGSAVDFRAQERQEIVIGLGQRRFLAFG
jgi:hypothetical protein